MALKERAKRTAKGVLATIGLLGGAYYIVRTARGSLHELGQLGMSVSAVDSLTLLLGVILTLVLSTAYHIHTVARIEPVEGRALRIATAYSLGQIVRYIPGKIAGLIFQANYLSGIVKPSSVAIALIVQTVYDNLWTLVFAGSILAYAGGHSILAVLLVLTSIAALHWSHRRAWIERILLFPGMVRRRLDPAQLARVRSAHPATLATAALVAVWMPMFLALALFLGDLATPLQVAVLGACYLLASIGSMLVFVVPSGVVIREAMFLFIGTSIGIDQGLLVYSGIVLRLALTMGEVACAGLFSALPLVFRMFEAQRHGPP